MTQPKQFANLVDMFQRSATDYAGRELFGTKVDGTWQWTTYAETAKLVDQFRGGLAAMGFQRGDKVCIVSNNRVEWAVAAYACFGLGVALVPMYEAQLPKEWAFIANDCGAVGFITATDQIFEKVTALKSEVPTLKHVIGFSLAKDNPHSYAALLEQGKAHPVPAIVPELKDVACLIYTSGTTGNPKGVILSHGNIISNINAVQSFLPMTSVDRSLSFLPWAHSFGFTVELHGMISCGASIAICESVEKIVQNLSEVGPSVLMSVPRIFNRIYDNVNKQMTEKPAIIQSLFRNALAAASKRRGGQKLGFFENLGLELADKLIFTKIRAKFGGKLRYAFSGGAALSKEVGEFIDSLGITVFEGYGLTETSPIATANQPQAHRIGSVGKAIPGVRIHLDKTVAHDPEQGEIVVYGPNVMVGYHNRKEENDAVFTSDGGFRTGDLGRLDADGFLYITGRIKEQYKLENGKYVAPAPLEEYLKLSPMILNTMIYGDNRLYNVALIVPEPEALKAAMANLGITGSLEELLAHPKAKEVVMAEVDKYSSPFKGFERVKAIALIAEDFTTQNDLLTPSLKLKRRVALQRFGSDLEALYASPPPKGVSASA